jgi:hypothetical protein
MRALTIALILTATATAEAERRPVAAARIGWAYGLGGEVEVRPGSWGIGASGGYVPGLGVGGYVGVQWGRRALHASGWVAEAGGFRGVHNALRTAATGYGAYALGGYTVRRGKRLSIRAVAGGGIPLDDPAHRPSFEFLAKLTAGAVV